MSRGVLSVGLDPALVSASASSRAAFPDVDAETIRAGVAENQAVLQHHGFRTDVCLVNVTREVAPRAVLVFNTSPTSTADAVLRWFPERVPLADAPA